MKKLLLICLLCAGCGDAEPAWRLTEIKRIEPVVGVFMNKADHYTVLIKTGNKIVPQELRQHFRSGASFKYSDQDVFTIIQDVAEDKPMYVLANVYRADNDARKRTEYEIHVHSPDEVAGGRWENKTGKNSTETGKVKKIR